MDGLILLLIFLLVLLVLIAIPIGTSVLIYRFVVRKDFNKWFRLIALVPFLVIGYLIYSGFYPSDEFYQEDFKEVTGLNFPERGEIIEKTADYPDHFGDYTSVSLVKVGEVFYKMLPDHLLEKGFKENDEKISSAELSEVLNAIGDREIVRELSILKDGGIYYYVGFLSDKESIIVKRLSW